MINEKNKYLPDLNSVPQDVLKNAKMLWINYPNNPTSAVADLEFYNRVVEFASNNDIIVCHDGPYSEVAYDGYQPVSFLQAEGARDIGVEFHSLSKSYNMTGWRIGMVVGNADIVGALRTLKSNLDSGIPQAIQYMAIEALTGPQDEINRMITEFDRRRGFVYDSLKEMPGIQVLRPKGAFYIFPNITGTGKTSEEITGYLLDEAKIAVVPGSVFGKYGEGYIRISYANSYENLEIAMSNMKAALEKL